MTSSEGVDEAERADQLADEANLPTQPLPLEAEPADALEQTREAPLDDDDYRDG